MLHIIVCLVLCLFELELFAHTSYALLREKGEICPYFGYDYYQTSHFWNKHGKKRNSFNHLKRSEIESYTEYGLTNNDTLFLTANYYIVKEKVNGNSRGLGDLEFGIKHRLFEDDSQVLSAQLLAIIPTGEHKVPLRYGRFGGEFDLRYFRCLQLCNCPFWIDSSVGYRYYNGFPSDQIRAEAKFGLSINDYIIIEANSYLYYGLFNGKKTHFQNQILFNPNFRLFKQEIQLIVRLTQCAWLTIGCYQHLWGENIGTGGGYFGGLWLDF